MVVRGIGAHFQYFKQNPNGGYETTDQAIALAVGAWQHIMLRLDFSASPAQGFLSINGGSLLSVLIATAGAISYSFEVGATYTQDTSSNGVVRFDNVAVDLR
jgi:hypothetical protein